MNPFKIQILERSKERFSGDESYLSQDNARKLVHFTIHENNQGDRTHRAFPAGFDPSAAFHEYRFDWTSRGVEYYLDGKRVATLTGNTPKQPGKVLLNHWTKSAADWGGGPPLNDALMYVKYIEVYFD